MSFILRAAFWLTVLAFLLPTAGPQSTAQNGNGGAIPASYTGETTTDDIGAGEMLSLAAQSAGDVLGFCDRNPQVCSRGNAVAGHIARQGSYYGAQAFLWLTEKARETQNSGPEATAAEAMPRPPARKTYTGA
mgnify:CR=1 FL=1|tara:strand:- start:13861 stop:14259 length:399 start_codon:yes stop_codon:yes gene_type:complete